ncbi:mediator of RNA polymerase II transcription subunit 13-like isoform X3 [Juglans microcarpa x Juglans regia]|uniref:mediator of RNA polymerase II transcription subunit 13-like isoform X3 n=1 Tax=Juglans microcarpa x Juglans regia TaxID=2249226 RepID=UPI001B7E75B6|nr:mediator of RNA polymerase II transcription subunit 13-like isoform X3 [Juglans microcarpa x Juglans regia]
MSRLVLGWYLRWIPLSNSHYRSGFCSGSNLELMEGSWTEINGILAKHGYNRSSNGNDSSISRSSSDSDHMMNTAAGELEGDDDNLTCRQSGLSSNDHSENGPKLGSKRPRTGMTDSFGQVGTETNDLLQEAYKSDFVSMEVDNSAITGVANDQIGSHWDYDDDDICMVMDIQTLLSEFGDFGDFFENDALPFGEPPGTAESQTLIFSTPDYGDVGTSPVGMMDVSDQMLLPGGFPSFESFDPPVPVAQEEYLGNTQEVTKNSMLSGLGSHTPASSTGEFNHIIKAEALMRFASEYGAVETPTSEFSSSICRSPYFPKSIKEESSNSSSSKYIYGATPPFSPYFNGSDEKTSMPMNSIPFLGRNDADAVIYSKNNYTHVESAKEPYEKRLLAVNSFPMSDGVTPSLFPNLNSTNAVKSSLRKVAEGTLELAPFLQSMKTLLATDVECLMFQASMCRIRHTLLSSSRPMPIGLSRLTRSTGFNQLPGDQGTMTDNTSGKYEARKKESMPLRIAGDIDVALDGCLNAPIGVLRSVGVPKVPKSSNSPNMEVSPSLPCNSFNKEGVLSFGQMQPLQELLDGMALLVQQATSFVDLTLDGDCGDGPYGWLALQEQWKQGFCCGPSMVHAGCGGTLASCHALDIAGVELVDPPSADSDVKRVLKSAFGILDGPLSVNDWCKGRNHSVDAGSAGDGFSAKSSINECTDSSSTVMLSAAEPMDPSHYSASRSSCLKVSSATGGATVDGTCQRISNQEIRTSEPCAWLRPTLFALPLPAILVGYQDDWLKTSASTLKLWEKAPLKPYSLQKPVTYNVICPDIDPLTSAAADFFQQLGTVYETCKLGSHSPQSLGDQMEIDSAKWSSSGFVLLDCPQSMRIESSNASLMGSISNYFLSLSNDWDLTSYLKSLSKALKGLKLSPYSSTNPRDGSCGPCMVIYVVCPFPDPTAVLQTVVESSVAVGSVILQSDRERSILHSQVGKALSCSEAVDEATISNVLVLSGFSIPQLVLQIVTVDAIFRVTSPSYDELVILKETAFTVYNKARRILRGSSNDMVQLSSLSSRSPSVLTQMSSPISGMLKDCVGPQISVHSLSREGDIEANLRTSAWDNSWQTTRTEGLSCESVRTGYFQGEIHYMFEPLFILAEPGSIEHGISPAISGNMVSEPAKPLSDDSSGGFMQGLSSAGSADAGSCSQLDGSESIGSGFSQQKTPPSLHCCYGWTEDWRWLVCIWTDSRGELLDNHVFPFGGISSRQDTKGLQCLFVQVLQQGCQILQACSSPDIGVAKPRDFVIVRIGSFFELEYLEWQKAINSIGGSEVKKWPLQLRQSVHNGIPASSDSTSLEQQELSLIQETLHYAKASGFIKGDLGKPAARKKLMCGQTLVDCSRGLLQWVQSISFVAISVDHSLNLVSQEDSSSPGGTQGGGGMGPSGYHEGFKPVQSLGSTFASYILIPSPSMHFLPATPLQLPACLTTESPPLAHLLHSKGPAIPLSTGFVVSNAVPSMRKDYRSNLKEEWPSVLCISLIDYYGGTNIIQDMFVGGVNKQDGRSLSSEAKDFEIETHLVLESVAAELHALSWMTVSPAYLERRTALPIHCDMVLRLRRLLQFADKELSQQPNKLHL